VSMSGLNKNDGFDVLVIGGGPAGLAAAARAAECGRHVAIVDDNPNLGGQIWRGAQEEQGTEASKWIERIRKAGVTILCGLRVVDRPQPGFLLAESFDGFSNLAYDNLILATGARERFLPFPGWTLPNVMGAGGLPAMVKSGLPIAGKRVVVAGSGPLLLAVAVYLRKHGADIPLICEQASGGRLAKFGLALAAWPEKLVQGLQLKRDLVGVSFAANSWPLAAEGYETLERVRVLRANKVETIPCDYLACGFHLVPNIELPLLVGCAVRNGHVQVDDFQKTTVSSVYCAGEPTGIGGVEQAIIEGQIAGLAAAGRANEAQSLFGKREKTRRFAQLLERTFRLRPELRSLPMPETIICRCEDVSYARLHRQSSWRAAKLQTRCGMGACQGRVCGPATQFLFNWSPESIRPPVFPARVETLASAAEVTKQHSEAMGGH
jgi:D-hydroxyproline dehydrogenase subunit alpha